MNDRSRACFFLAWIISATFALSALSAFGQNNWNGYNNGSNPYQGKLNGEDQKRFDDYYVKWIHDRERKDTGEIASMEVRMLDVYAHAGIPSNVPYDLVASPNVALPMTGYQNWQGRLRPDDQKRFDSYFTRWMEYRSKKDRDQIASMQGRMLDENLVTDKPGRTTDRVGFGRSATDPDTSQHDHEATVFAAEIATTLAKAIPRCARSAGRNSRRAWGPNEPR